MCQAVIDIEGETWPCQRRDPHDDTSAYAAPIHEHRFALDDGTRGVLSWAHGDDIRAMIKLRASKPDAKARQAARRHQAVRHALATLGIPDQEDQA